MSDSARARPEPVDPNQLDLTAGLPTEHLHGSVPADPEQAEAARQAFYAMFLFAPPQEAP